MKCRLLAILRDRDLTLESFGKKIGMDKGNLSKIGSGRDVRVSTAMKIIRKLRVPVEEVWPDLHWGKK